jgi:hypothetical protein
VVRLALLTTPPLPLLSLPLLLSSLLLLVAAVVLAATKNSLDVGQELEI